MSIQTRRVLNIVVLQVSDNAVTGSVDVKHDIFTEDGRGKSLDCLQLLKYICSRRSSISSALRISYNILVIIKCVSSFFHCVYNVEWVHQYRTCQLFI